jgi:type IV pilus assembly protein PilV
MTPSRFKRLKAQAGVSLVEILVAVLVLALGLLGMAGMQARAIKSSNSSYSRTQAVMLSYYMMDAMRADKVAAMAATYDMDKTCATTDPDISGTGLANTTRRDWIGSLRKNLVDLPTTCGEIACSGDVCTVTVYWDDSLAGGLEDQTFTTSSRL